MNEEGSSVSFTYRQLRKDSIKYAEFLDTYAPCIAGEALWHDRGMNVLDCAGNNTNRLAELLTVSDEAFLVVCFVNYHARWNAEYDNIVAKVSVAVTVVSLCMFLFVNTNMLLVL